MGLTRFELVTPSLSEKCSNQLSYRPNINIKNRSGKEGRTLPPNNSLWVYISPLLAFLSERR